MEIILAKSAGFCFGVNRAIEVLYNEMGSGKIYTYGPIIHNKVVNEDLRQKGVTIIESLEDISEGLVVLRTHGVGKNTYDELNLKDIKYIDGTCPFVSKIHKIVKEHFERGEGIIIIGDKGHPEVKGINGWCENCGIVIGSLEEINDTTFEKDKQYAVVVQTTFRKNKFDEIIYKLKYLNLKISVYNTICLATSERQQEAIELSQNVDKMIVIGDKTSSNTQKLFEICKKNCINTFYIETIRDLELNIFYIDDKIGITAGASTPPALIKEVINTMSEVQKDQNTSENEELTFQQLLDESFVSLRTGDVVKGAVIQISNEEISVNLGYKSDGIIPRGEFSSNPDVVPSQSVSIGDEIEVFVVRVNDGEGNVLLSKKRLEAQKGMDDIEKAFMEKALVTGKVTEIVKGGLIAVSNGVRVFIPSSQVSNRFVEDLKEFKDKEIVFNIIEFDKSKRRIIGGRKEMLAKELNEKKVALFEKISVGERISGAVSRLTDFGAFIDLGGADGLIHISEMSWGRIKHPKELLKEGQTVDVVVLDVDKEKGKISLSLKDIKEDPWKTALEKYVVDSVVLGKVVRMVPFGAFIELEPGVDGLVHISQISNRHVVRPEDELKIGQEIEVKVMEVNAEQKKISLSKKALEIPEEDTVSEDDIAEPTAENENNDFAEAEQQESISQGVSEDVQEVSEDSDTVVEEQIEE